MSYSRQTWEEHIRDYTAQVGKHIWLFSDSKKNEDHISCQHCCANLKITAFYIWKSNLIQYKQTTSSVHTQNWENCLKAQQPANNKATVCLFY